MSKTFEEILQGRKLHELTDEEIDEIVSSMKPEELGKFDKAVKKESKNRKKAPSKKKEKMTDEFNKALFGGEES